MTKILISVVNLFSILCIAVGFSAWAGDDACDDYFQRHSRADLIPLGISLANVPRQGDLPASQQLTIQVRNVGELPLGVQAPPGSLFSATQVGVALSNGGRFRGFIPAPFAAGAQTTLAVSLPENTIQNCQALTVQIDPDRRAGQHGCLCYGNDSVHFDWVHIRGMRPCYIIKPPRIGEPGDEQNNG